MAVVFFGEICRRCGRAIPPVEASQFGDSLRGHLHEKCYVAESSAWDALTQQLNSGSAIDFGYHCADCHKSVDEIERLTGKRTMYVHTEDEMAVLLCRICSDHRTALMNARSVRGKFKHLSKEEFFARCLDYVRPWKRFRR